MEQRYRAVLEVHAGVRRSPRSPNGSGCRASGAPVARPLSRAGPGRAGGSVAPSASSPGQTPPEVEAAVCELRREHPRWGARAAGRSSWAATAVPGRCRRGSTVYRVLVRHGLIDAEPRAPAAGGLQAVGARPSRWSCGRWTSSAASCWPTAAEAKVVTGVDDHSRFCVIATVVRRATGRAVCLAFAEALRRLRGPGGGAHRQRQAVHRPVRQAAAEVLFDRICRENGITHRLTQPALADHDRARSSGSTRPCSASCSTTSRCSADLETAQAAIDAFRRRVQHRPAAPVPGHGVPGRPVRPRPADERLPLRLPPRCAATIAAPRRRAAPPPTALASRAGSCQRRR